MSDWPVNPYDPYDPPPAPRSPDGAANGPPVAAPAPRSPDGAAVSDRQPESRGDLDPMLGLSWKERAIALWQILDDIDTMSDALKDDAAHGKDTCERVQQRHRYLMSDGQELYTPEEWAELQERYELADALEEVP